MTREARLWTLALHIEEGAADLTARALEQARQALQDALDAQKRGEKIEQAEIDRRMKEVQDALQKHLQALADQARRDPDSQQFDPNAHPLDTRDMQRLADEMRDAAREGRMDDARQKLAELEKLLDEMKNMQAGNGRMTPSERARAAQRQRGQQQMNALRDIVQRAGHPARPRRCAHGGHRAAAPPLVPAMRRAFPFALLRRHWRLRPPRPIASPVACPAACPIAAALRRDPAAPDRYPRRYRAAPGARRAHAAIRRPHRQNSGQPQRRRHRHAQMPCRRSTRATTLLPRPRSRRRSRPCRSPGSR